MLTTWNRRDDNATPAVNCLQPRTGRNAEPEIWESEVEQPLGKWLRQAITSLDTERAFQVVQTFTALIHESNREESMALARGE